MIIKWALVLLFGLLAECSHNSDDDLIKGWMVVDPKSGEKSPLKHYAGYLEASADKKVFYWFFEAENNTDTAPIIVYLSSGPGCSSLHTALYGNGPFIPNDGQLDSLERNPDSWNQNAGIVYIESPIWTGFSYDSVPLQHRKIDDITATVDNLSALKDFFDIHPNQRNRSIYLMGESYAGITIPMLAKKLIEEKEKFQIEIAGVAIGNGVLDQILRHETAISFAYYHGLVDEKLYLFLKRCCKGSIENCIPAMLDGYCGDLAMGVLEYVYYGPYNAYSIYSTTCKTNHSKSVELKPLGRPNMELFLDSESGSDHFLSHLSASYDCVDDSKAIAFLTNPNVINSLNVSENSPKWEACNTELLHHYNQIKDTVRDEIVFLLENKISVLLYFGNTDAVSGFIQGQKFAHQLGRRQTFSRYPWYIDSAVRGEYVGYDGLWFVTINGGSHMATIDQKNVTRYLIERFMENNGEERQFLA